MAAVPPDAGLKLLVLAEDWCGDASNSIPVLAKLTDLAPGLELRVLRRDEHPDVMDRYLTNGSRSIPVVIALDRAFQELGHWGPRPRMLQEWVLEERKKGTRRIELYPGVRRWYARDAGETTLREVLSAAGVADREGRVARSESLPFSVRTSSRIRRSAGSCPAPVPR